MRIRGLLDKELAKRAELNRLNGMLDMIECVRIGELGAHKETQKGYRDGRKAIEKGISKLKGTKRRDITGFFKPGTKF